MTQQGVLHFSCCPKATFFFCTAFQKLLLVLTVITTRWRTQERNCMYFSKVPALENTEVENIRVYS